MRKQLWQCLTLKHSKHQRTSLADIEAAIGAVKESDAYLFGSDEPFKNPVGSTGNGGSGGADGVVCTSCGYGTSGKQIRRS